MIRAKNLGEIIVDLSVPGALAANANAKTFVVPFNAVLKAVFAKLGTAGVTGSQAVDLLANGASLVSSGTLFSFATTSQACTYGNANLISNPPQLAKGTILEINIGAPQTTPAKDLAILIVLERQRAAGNPAQLQTDTIGADSDAI